MSEKTPPIIAIDQLEFGYKANVPILKQLSLEVPQNSIYGFLGANGAGKTTTIRSILGLLRPQKGNISIFGHPLATNRIKILEKVGSLIESPSLYPHLTGLENLKVASSYLQVAPSRINQVLDFVNLTPHQNKLARKYSTGMKQRLGLAIALLNDPDLLILDEPTNGLDPSGIIEIRNILQQLKENGKTIFLSSHLLSEIEKIATQVGIIHHGKMIFQGTIQQLEAIRQQSLVVRLVVSSYQAAFTLIKDNFQVARLNNETMQVQVEDREQIPDMINELVQKQIRIYEVSAPKNDLEQLFINLTKEHH